jgi:hypothetical protein
MIGKFPLLLVGKKYLCTHVAIMGKMAKAPTIVVMGVGKVGSN